MFCTPAFDYFEKNLIHTNTNYLEIGIYYADALKRLSVLYPKKTFYGIDPFLEDGHTAHETHVKTGDPLELIRKEALKDIHMFPNIKLYEMKSSEFFTNELNSETINTLNIGSILIDGSHHYDDVIIDIEIAMKLIDSKNGLIFFDDLHIEGVSRAVNKFEIDYKDKIVNKNILTDWCIVYNINNK
jgi:hypothetical protein